MTANSKRALVAAIIVCIAFVCLTYWLSTFCIMETGITAKPAEMYETFTVQKVTPDVQHIEMIGGGWQGTDLWLRFECNSETLNKIKSQGYVRISGSELTDAQEFFDFQSQSNCFIPDHFSTPWNPGDLDSQTIYKLSNFKNDFSTSGFNYLTVNEQTGLVHLYHWGTS